MTQVSVVIRIGQGSFEEGFSVGLILFENSILRKEYRPRRGDSGDLSPLPPAPEIPRLYEIWHENYFQLGRTRDSEQNENPNSRSFEIPGGQTTHLSSFQQCQEAANDLKEYLINPNNNGWFQQQEFIFIATCIQAKIRGKENNSIPILFDIDTGQTDTNLLLKKLPWHLWYCLFDELHNAEPVIGTQFSDSTGQLNYPVSVLPIYGGSQGLDLTEDRQAWQVLEENHCIQPLEPLLQPLFQKLSQSLQNQSFQILFFAGHSNINETGNTGSIQIRDGCSIQIDNIRDEIREAVRNGLKLAIFNSCNGLGLASRLDNATLPVAIVMREPIPDEVAREFIRSFLRNFSEQGSIYAAMRRTRQDLNYLECRGNNPYPNATWIPIICQNLSQPELKWPEFIPPQIDSPKPPWLQKLLILLRKKSIPIAAAILTAMSIIMYGIWSDTLYDSRNIEVNSTPMASMGEDIFFTKKNGFPKCTYAQKETARDEIKAGNIDNGIEAFNKYLGVRAREGSSSPLCKDSEAQIYLQNIKPLNQTEKLNQASLLFGLANPFQTLLSDNSYRIAVILPVSENPNESKEILNGVAKRQEEINKNGGINGKKLEVLIVREDIKGDNEPSNTRKQVVNKLLKDRKVKAVIGHYTTDSIAATEDFYRQKSVTLISPTSTGVRTLILEGKEIYKLDHVLRLAPLDLQAAKVLADDIEAQRRKKVGIIYDPNSDYSRSLKDSFMKISEQKPSLEVVILENCKFGSTQYTKCQDEIKEKGVDSLLLTPPSQLKNSDVPSIVQEVLADLQKDNKNLPLWGGDAIYGDSTSQIRITVNQKEYPAFCGIAPFSIRSAIPFMPKEKKWTDPGLNWRSVNSYDALTVIEKALNKNPKRSKLRDTILGISKIESSTGDIEFIENNNDIDDARKEVDGFDSFNEHWIGVGDRFPSKQLSTIAKIDPNSCKWEPVKKQPNKELGLLY